MSQVEALAPEDALGARPLCAVVATSSTSFVRHVFEAYRQGRVVVSLRPGMARDAVEGCAISEVVEPEQDHGWFDDAAPDLRDHGPAQITLTSGTEGRPKAMVLSHAALADTVDRLNDVMQVDESIREYVGVPVTYSFGFGRCRAVAAAGGRFFVPEGGFNPAEIGRMLAGGEINAISAVPTLWRILLQNEEAIGAHGAAVRWIEIGSQYMSRSEKERMKALFPNARIVQHYGLTEASRTTFLEVSEVEGDALESVGRPTGDVEVRLADDGRIRIRGPHLSMGRLVEGDLVPIVDGEGWLETADLGELRDGLLYFRGRADDVINIAGVKLSP